MSEYIVAEAGVTKSGLGTNGDMKEITLRFQDGVQATWFCKQDTAVPAPGTSVQGEIEDSQWGKKFKKARSGGFGGGGFGGGKMDPAREQKIVRQHSQEMALRYVAAKDVPLNNGIEDLTKIIDWFQKDALGQDAPVETVTTNPTLNSLNETLVGSANGSGESVPF